MKDESLAIPLIFRVSLLYQWVGPGRRFERKNPCKKRMNNCHRSRGFSLIEVLASCMVLSFAAIGITAVWRLADSKALLARLDHRASRILREYYELQTF